MFLTLCARARGPAVNLLRARSATARCHALPQQLSTSAFLLQPPVERDAFKKFEKGAQMDTPKHFNESDSADKKSKNIIEVPLLPLSIHLSYIYTRR
jgi:hypothetical protein